MRSSAGQPGLKTLSNPKQWILLVVLISVLFDVVISKVRNIDEKTSFVLKWILWWKFSVKDSKMC